MSVHFNFSYGTLVQRADRIDDLFQRDSAELLDYGYGEETRLELLNKTNEFRVLPSDDHWVGLQMVATDKKKTLQENLINQLTDLRHRAKGALGEKSIEYRTLRFTKMKGMKEQDLLVLARHIISNARPLLDQLAARNVTAEKLDHIDTIINELDDAIDAQKAAMSTRDAKTLEREEKANEIYRLISEICSFGKTIWEGKNEAYYNDYVIYGSKDSIAQDLESEEPKGLATAP